MLLRIERDSSKRREACQELIRGHWTREHPGVAAVEARKKGCARQAVEEPVPEGFALSLRVALGESQISNIVSSVSGPRRYAGH